MCLFARVSVPICAGIYARVNMRVWGILCELVFVHMYAKVTLYCCFGEACAVCSVLLIRIDVHEGVCCFLSLTSSGSV